MRPHLEYANPVSAPVYRNDLSITKNVQMTATHTMLSLNDVSYEERLARLNLLSLYYRRACGDMIKAYEHVKGALLVHTHYQAGRHR